jgi:hypothetical protein
MAVVNGKAEKAHRMTQVQSATSKVIGDKPMRANAEIESAQSVATKRIGSTLHVIVVIGY